MKPAAPPTREDTDRAGGDQEMALRRALAETLRDARGGVRRLATVRRRPFAETSAFRAELLTLELADGERLEIFLKDLSSSRLAKDDLQGRRRRELEVYRRLLPPSGLGPPRYHGAVWDERRRRFWLLLELVDGRRLGECKAPLWEAAAGWLGRLHGEFGGREQLLRRSAALQRHDQEFFLRAAERAERELGRLSRTLARRLGGLLSGYDEIARWMASTPPTLVHGSYRPQNILVAGPPAEPRICPVDWELAAIGSRLHDLAYLADGWEPPALDALLDAYESKARECDVPVPPRTELRAGLDRFRFHRSVASLGHCAGWRQPDSTAVKVLGMADRLRHRLG